MRLLTWRLCRLYNQKLNTPYLFAAVPNNNMNTKLKVGSIILVHGWIMLKGLNSGQKYRVQSIPNHYGSPTYQFTKPKGKNTVARHYAHDVDVWICASQDLNKIEIVHQNTPILNTNPCNP